MKHCPAVIASGELDALVRVWVTELRFNGLLAGVTLDSVCRRAGVRGLGGGSAATHEAEEAKSCSNESQGSHCVTRGGIVQD